jgi:hypothetical protein
VVLRASFKERRLASAVSANQPQAFTTPRFEGDIIHSPEFLRAQLIMVAVTAHHFIGYRLASPR